jgi:hypothetical protein
MFVCFAYWCCLVVGVVLMCEGGVFQRKGWEVWDCGLSIGILCGVEVIARRIGHFCLSLLVSGRYIFDMCLLGVES